MANKTLFDLRRFLAEKKLGTWEVSRVLDKSQRAIQKMIIRGSISNKDMKLLEDKYGDCYNYIVQPKED